MCSVANCHMWWLAAKQRKPAGVTCVWCQNLQFPPYWSDLLTSGSLVHHCSSRLLLQANTWNRSCLFLTEISEISASSLSQTMILCLGFGAVAVRGFLSESCGCWTPSRVLSAFFGHFSQLKSVKLTEHFQPYLLSAIQLHTKRGSITFFHKWDSRFVWTK